MKRSASIVAFAWVPLPALGEVCDKVNETWKPGSDPIAFWPEVVSIATSPLGLIVILCCLAVAATSRASLHFAAAGMLAIGTASLLVFEDPIIAMARKEGCLGPAWAWLFPLFALASGMLARALVLRSRRG